MILPTPEKKELEQPDPKIIAELLQSLIKVGTED